MKENWRNFAKFTILNLFDPFNQQVKYEKEARKLKMHSKRCTRT